MRIENRIIKCSVSLENNIERCLYKSCELWYIVTDVRLKLLFRRTNRYLEVVMLSKNSYIELGAYTLVLCPIWNHARARRFSDRSPIGFPYAINLSPLPISLHFGLRPTGQINNYAH